MNERILKWLYDIRAAILEIEGYFEEYQLEIEVYKSNIILKRAVERDLEIIGDAVNRIIRNDEAFPIPHARKIVGLRNEIIHAYDGISDENIYSILVKHLPALKNEVQALIERSETG